MTYSNTITHQSKTIVDTSNTLWTMDYDMYDNSVTIVSDRGTIGGYAVLNQYSIDNALGHDIPDSIVYSAEDMINQDNDSLLRSMTTSIVAADIAESYDDNKFYA
jgi:hypothetical protein